MKQYIDQIRLSVPPSLIISRKVQLKQKSPDEYLGLCPFHKEKTPSFSVSDRKGFYHCFGCGAHGDVFAFLMKQEGLSYKEALEELAKIAGVKLPKYTSKQIDEQSKEANISQIIEATALYYHSKLYSFEGREALTYLHRRGLNDDIIQKFRLGYAPKFSDELSKFLLQNHARSDIIASTALLEGGGGGLYNLFKDRVIFPIMNKRGHVIAFGGRILGQGEPKYLNSPENPIFKKGQNLFAITQSYEAAYKAKQAIVVEGYMDVISLVNKGINNVFAPLGTALKIDQIKLLWNLVDEPVVCMDNDMAGKKAMEKIALMALESVKGGKSLRFATVYDAKDPDEFISKFDVKAFYKLMEGSQPLVNALFEIEKKRKPIDTPEQQIDFKLRLSGLCEQIKEPNMQKAYKRFFMDKYYELSAKKYARKNVNDNGIDQNSIVTSVMSVTENIREREILALLMLHPELLMENNVENYLISMELSCKKLDIIRNNLLSILNYGEETGSKVLCQDVLKSLKLEFDVEEILDVGAAAHIEDPKSHLERMFELDELRSIQEKVAYVHGYFVKEPTGELFDKLKHLKQLEESLKLKLGIN